MSLITVLTAAETRDLTELATVKEALGITGVADDALLARLISAASRIIEDFTDRVFARELVTEKLGADKGELGGGAGSPRMMLTRIPILMVDAVRFDGDPVDLETIEVENADAGFLFRREGFSETLIERQEIERVRTGRLEPLWEFDYTAGFVLPTFAGISKPFASVDIDTAADTIAIADHGLLSGDTVRFSTDGILPTVLATSRDHFPRDVTTGAFKVANVPGGAALDFTDGGTGTHNVTRQVTFPASLENDVIETVVSMFRRKGQDPRIEMERLSDHTVKFATFGSGRVDTGIPESVAARLQRWRNLV